jgi:CubicO group peptidase (beta-lactamase class C family)
LTPDDVEARVCTSRLRDGWQPGADVRYSNWHGYSTLGVVAATVAGRPFNSIVRDFLFEPLALRDCWVGVDESSVASVAERVAFVYDVAGSTPEVLPFGGIFQGRDLETCSPASGGLGSMRALGRIYESFLDSLVDRQSAVLAASTMRQMLRRAQLTDGRPAPHGLGFLLVPRIFGSWCPNAFGHPGLRCVQAFADPESRLVVAAAVNGLGRGLEHTDVLPAAAQAVHDTLVEVGAL